MIDFEALFKISYGLYIVSSGDKTEGNGFIANTVFQVTAEPPRFAICCNKNNYTSDYLNKYQVFSVSILARNASSEIIGKFGYKSGKNINKFADSQVQYGETGVPIILNDCIAYLECKVEKTLDLGTHILYIGELINAETIDKTKEPLTYQHYREVKKGVAPKNAPTYIDKTKLVAKSINVKKYKCPVCGYIYDESTENVKFKDLQSDWLCPICGAEKIDFIEI
jgi:flavin reductase (DIM6/NTAB) family NADH-FMN oxidoreductase RutF/rubredoxin